MWPEILALPGTYCAPRASIASPLGASGFLNWNGDLPCGS